jgi:hypothetical protein
VLGYACVGGHTSIVRYLLSKGADLGIDVQLHSDEKTLRVRLEIWLFQYLALASLVCISLRFVLATLSLTCPPAGQTTSRSSISHCSWLLQRFAQSGYTMQHLVFSPLQAAAHYGHLEVCRIRRPVVGRAAVEAHGDVRPGCFQVLRLLLARVRPPSDSPAVAARNDAERKALAQTQTATVQSLLDVRALTVPRAAAASRVPLAFEAGPEAETTQVLNALVPSALPFIARWHGFHRFADLVSSFVQSYDAVSALWLAAIQHAHYPVMSALFALPAVRQHVFLHVSEVAVSGRPNSPIICVDVRMRSATCSLR